MPPAGLPLAIRAAFLWNRFGLRGRSAVPRAVGNRWKGRDVFIPIRHGGVLSVDPSNLDVYAYIFNAGGLWDGHVMETCERLLRPGEVFYDIGANTGVFAIDAALAIAGLRVYAFEPQPSLARHIRQSIEANALKTARCLECLLGQEDGETTLYLTSHAIHASLVPREAQFRTLPRPMRTLDSLVASREVDPPDVIKIDVEGAEIAVFRGAIETLRTRTPSVVFEADENLLRFNAEIEDVFGVLLQAAPYRFFQIRRADSSLVEAKRPYGFGDYVALSPRHAGRI